MMLDVDIVQSTLQIELYSYEAKFKTAKQISQSKQFNGVILFWYICKSS